MQPYRTRQNIYISAEAVLFINTNYRVFVQSERAVQWRLNLQTADLSPGRLKCRLKRKERLNESDNKLSRHLPTVWPKSWCTRVKSVKTRDTHFWLKHTLRIHGKNYCVAFFKATGDRFLWLMLCCSTCTPSHTTLFYFHKHLIWLQNNWRTADEVCRENSF